MTKAIHFILAVFNWLPMFHCSNDEQFGSFDNTSDARFSLFVFPFGVKKYYFLTYRKSIGFKLNYTLPFKIDLETVNEKAQAYEKYIKDKAHDKEQVKIQIECLRDMISDKNASSALLNNKINLYTSVLLVFLGSWFFLLSEIIKFKTELFEIKLLLWILFFLSGGYILNSLLFVHYTLKVKPSVHSMFSELKGNPDFNQFAKNKYIDWFSLKENLRNLASVVMNIEKYFIRGFITSAFVWIVVFFNSNITFNEKTRNVKYEFLVFNQNGEFMPSEFSKFTSKLDKLKNEQIIYLVAKKNSKEFLLVRDFLEGILKNKKNLKSIPIKSSVLDERSVILTFEE